MAPAVTARGVLLVASCCAGRGSGSRFGRLDKSAVRRTAAGRAGWGPLRGALAGPRRGPRRGSAIDQPAPRALSLCVCVCPLAGSPFAGRQPAGAFALRVVGLIEGAIRVWDVMARRGRCLSWLFALAKDSLAGNDELAAWLLRVCSACLRRPVSCLPTDTAIRSVFASRQVCQHATTMSTTTTLEAVHAGIRPPSSRRKGKFERPCFFFFVLGVYTCV